MFSIMKPRAVLFGMVALLCSAAYFPSSAATVLIDNFDYTPPSGTQLYTVYRNDVPFWSESERNSDDVAILRYPNNNGGPGVMQLRDYQDGLRDATATRYNISIAGLTNISISFDYLGHDTGAGDFLYLEWKLSDETTWRSGTSRELLSDNFQTAVVNLDNLVTKGKTSIDIRFWTDVTDSTSELSWCKTSRGYKQCTVVTPGSHTQTAKVDDIIMGYTVVPPPGNSAVPVPGALPLFASGAAVLGGLLYRRKRKAQNEKA